MDITCGTMWDIECVKLIIPVFGECANVAVCCRTHGNTLQHTATRGNIVQHMQHVITPSAPSLVQMSQCVVEHTATHYNTRQHTETLCNTCNTSYPPVHHHLRDVFGDCATVAVCCSVLLKPEDCTDQTFANTLQHAATHGNTLQHTATHGNTVQHMQHAIPPSAPSLTRCSHPTQNALTKCPALHH